MTMSATMMMTVGGLPTACLDQGTAVYLDLPNLFRDDQWKHLDIGAPPGSIETRRELEELLEKQRDEREQLRRRQSILTDADGVITQFHRAVVFTPATHPATYRLVHAMEITGSVTAHHYKQLFDRPRPTELEASIKPIIDVPRCPSFPSAHATQAHLIAQALAAVVGSPKISERVYKIANRIGLNREYAGVNYASDIAASKILATSLFPMVTSAFNDAFRESADEWLGSVSAWRPSRVAC